MANIGSIYRMDFLRENNIKYNESYVSAEDYDFIAQIIMNNGRIEYVNSHKSLVLYRRHKSNGSQYYHAGLLNQKNAWKKMHQRDWKKLDRCDVAKQFLEKYPNVFSLFQQQVLMIETCEQKPKNILKVKHPNWRGEMIKSSSDSLMCFAKKPVSCA